MKRNREVRCIETEEVFYNIYAAADYYKLYQPNIVRAIDEGIMCGKLHWEYTGTERPDKDRPRKKKNKN